MGSRGKFLEKAVMGTSLISQAEELERIPDETVFFIPCVHKATGREVPEKEVFLFLHSYQFA